MAASFERQDSLTMLTNCPICLSTIRKPKALPCLHTFCFKCLKELAKSRNQFPCPVCKEEVEMPADGIKGFQNNFFVTKIIERKKKANELEQTPSCATCNSRINVLHVHRCLDCKQSLCENCLAPHKSRDHHLKTIDEIESETEHFEPEYCETHRDEELKGYCTTCCEFVCDECKQHYQSMHDVVELPFINLDHTYEIHLLTGEMESKLKELDYASKSYNEMKERLPRNVEQISQKIDQAADKVNEDFKRKLDERRQQLKGELLEWQPKVNQTITENISVLRGDKEKLKTALELASQVTHCRTAKGIAAMHKQLTSKNVNRLTKHRHPIKRSLISAKLFELDTENEPNAPDIGNLVLGCRKRDRIKTYELETQLGIEGDGLLCNGRGIAVCHSSGKVAVSDNGTAQVQIYDRSGEYKLGLNTKHGLTPGQYSYPDGIVMNTNGDYFITDCTQYVKKFDLSGNFQDQFPAVSHKNITSDEDDHKLQGLTKYALDEEEYLLVGEVKKKYVSKHYYDGTHIGSVKVKIPPQFLAVTAEENIIVSAWDLGTGVQILDPTGRLLFTLNSPQGVCYWKPSGVCYHKDINDIVFVANYGGDTDESGIFCFSTSNGEYLGCSNDDVRCPKGLALSEDATNMFVVVPNGVDVLTSCQSPRRYSVDPSSLADNFAEGISLV